MNKFKRGKVPYERSDEKIVYLKLCTKEKDCISSSSADNLEKRLRFVIHKLTTNTDTGFNLLEDIFECMVMNDSFQRKLVFLDKNHFIAKLEKMKIIYLFDLFSDKSRE